MVLYHIYTCKIIWLAKISYTRSIHRQKRLTKILITGDIWMVNQVKKDQLQITSQAFDTYKSRMCLWFSGVPDISNIQNYTDPPEPYLSKWNVFFVRIICSLDPLNDSVFVIIRLDMRPRSCLKRSCVVMTAEGTQEVRLFNRGLSAISANE